MSFDFAPGKTRIGWIGTGVMGQSMCGHLLSAGYQATVYNRTASRAQSLVDRAPRSPVLPKRSPRRATWSSRSWDIPATYARSRWVKRGRSPARVPGRGARRH
ncbi:MAG: NAD(P)-binding domain-containing protein [Isosphaeraceae bacterium]